MGDIVMTHTARHEFIGDFDISEENKYKVFDSSGHEIDDERLEEIMGAPMIYHSNELGIFDDADFLISTIPSLNPEYGVDPVN